MDSSSGTTGLTSVSIAAQRQGSRSPDAVVADAAAPTTSQTVQPTAHERAPLRLDIQGLRAVAVIAVVAFHLWPAAVPGGFVGVDVFFVISGFLITTHLIQMAPRSGRDLLSFWARRIRRLLPASLLVLLSTLVATVLLAPDDRWMATARHVMASALYVENRQLASDSVDYLRAADPPTAVQHFWSLGVEEQFYLIWPILILLAGLLALRLRWRSRVLIASSMAAVVVGSFALSVYMTATKPAAAYFSTPVRIWELGAGGLLATVLISWPPRWGRRGWWSLVSLGGLVAVGVAVSTFSGTTPFPGWRAALPVGGTVAVIAAGAFNDRTAPSRLLALRPLPFIGGISYSIYLWHWPIIVLLPYVSGRLGPLDQATVLIGTVVLAVLTKRFVEDPFRRPNARWIGRAPFRSAAVGMLVVVIAAAGVMYDVNTRLAAERAALQAAVDANSPCFGARALALGPQLCPYKPTAPVPSAAQAQLDRSVLYGHHCWATVPFANVLSCHYGNPSAKFSVALVGDSHAGQWLPALQPLMDEYDFNITSYVASGCDVTTTPMSWDTQADAMGCLAWAEGVMDATTSGRYDLVFTSTFQTRMPAGADGQQSAVALERAGDVDVLGRWTAAHVGVIVMRDPPSAPNKIGSIPNCLGIHPYDPSACSGKRRDWLREDPFVEAATSIQNPGITIIDLTNRFCSNTKCFGVVGGVTVYFDSNHLTQTYARTLAPDLAIPLQEALQRAAKR